MFVDAPYILIVEDEQPIAELLRFTLELSGWTVVTAETVNAAWESIHTRAPNLVLLDWMLPGLPGTVLLARIRRSKEFSELPVILLTAKGMEEDKVAGLDSGADLYMTKPFSPLELTARIKSLLRSRQSEQTQQILRVGPIQLNPVSYTVSVSEKAVKVGYNEFKLLNQLILRPDRVFPRDQLISMIWGDNKDIDHRTVDVLVLRLRKKLREAGNLIKTVRSVGYMLSEK